MSLSTIVSEVTQVAARVVAMPRWNMAWNQTNASNYSSKKHVKGQVKKKQLIESGLEGRGEGGDDSSGQ